MKRNFLIIVLLLIAMPMFAEHVDPETARKVATTFLTNNGSKATQLTDLTRKAGFSNLYILTSEEGFVVMSADDCVKPILGYSFTGEFVTEGMPENVRGWLQGYSDEIQYAIDNQMRASNETAQLWKELADGNSKAGQTTTVVAPLIQTKWNQNKYYNALCPTVSDGQDGHAYTGCVATAMAQIMKYWNYPTRGVGSHSYTWNNQTLSANFGTTTYDWDNMQPYYDYYFVNGTDSNAQWLDAPSPEQISAVATLMYHCGISVDMVYGGQSTGGSAAYTQDVPSALINYFNYSTDANFKYKNSYSNDEWVAMVKAELNAERPLEYCGSSSGGGHAFVCDGFDNNNYFHFNWGWSGRYDGYFSLDNLNTGANNQSGQGNGIFTYDQGAVFGIKPVQCSAEEPTNLTYTITGFQVTLNWTAGAGAASYNIYKDGMLLCNTTSTTYTDAIEYGTFSYFVKSKDANGALSLPTETVTVSKEPIPTNLNVTLEGNNAVLSWTEPELSSTPVGDITLTYGTGTHSGSTGVIDAQGYYGHRYPKSMLNPNEILYKVSFYADKTGSFALYVYSSTNGYSKPQTQLFTKSITVSTVGWSDINLDTEEMIPIDSDKDLWVFIYDPEAKEYPMGKENYSNADGGYFSATGSGGPTSWVGTMTGSVVLIRTYLMDGSFSYNLYDNGNTVIQNLSGNSHTVSNVTNNTAHQYTLKTIFNSSETSASNMAGITLGTASLEALELGTNDKMTVTANSKLTVTGTLSDSNTDNLILEDGAQLVHNSIGVKATVKKNINPYTGGENGWYFIASPVTENITPSEANGLIAGNYDLYLFNQSEDKAWRNYRAEVFTTVNHKKGYLYANDTYQTLSFSGTLANTTTATALDYDANARFKGFNLVGNPYPCNATINRDFCVISGKNLILAESGREIAPCEGVFVRATAANQELTFNKVTTGAKNQNDDQHLDLVVTQGKDLIDRARVRLNEGIGMEKFSLNDKHSQISLWQGGHDFAVAYTNGETEMPVSFLASENGTYTLTVSSTLTTQLSSLTYLHLIDNMTGIDIDLLASPSYTFEAKTSDYASRFKLVFNDNQNENNNENEPFAYIYNGEIVVETPWYDVSTIQVTDMLGRILLTREATPHSSLLIPNSSLSPGVYVLRLINDKQTKSQKIILNK